MGLSGMDSQERKPIRVGMVGYKFMGKAHAHAYRDLPFYFGRDYQVSLQAIAGRDDRAVREAAHKFGFASYETDWRKLIEREDIDLIDIVTPNNTHAEIAIEAARAGKHVLCEKPLAMSLDEARRMAEAVQKSGVTHMVCHNYRFAPAVQYAKKLIEQGVLGRIYHIRAQYLQDWIMDKSFPLVWRLRKDVTGSGALGDIGAHILDLARFLVGELHEVSGMMETFIKERPLGEMTSGLNASADFGQTGTVDVDDMTAFMARFETGAVGVFEATRFAAGNRNRNQFEINGEKGSIKWDLENMNWLQVYLTSDEPGLQGFRQINCTEEVHPYGGTYWPAGHIIGYEHTFINLLRELVDGIHGNFSPAPNFVDGLQNQIVLSAVEQSAEQRSWVDVVRA